MKTIQEPIHAWISKERIERILDNAHHKAKDNYHHPANLNTALHIIEELRAAIREEPPYEPKPRN